MKLSELAALHDGDPELMIDGPDGWPIPVTDASLGVMQVPSVGVVPYLLLETVNEEDGAEAPRPRRQRLQRGVGPVSLGLAFVCAKEDEQCPARIHQTSTVMKRCTRCGKRAVAGYWCEEEGCEHQDVDPDVQLAGHGEGKCDPEEVSA